MSNPELKKMKKTKKRSQTEDGNTSVKKNKGDGVVPLMLAAGPRTVTVSPGLFINGEFVPSESGNKFSTVNPATGESICEIYEAGPADVNKAVAAAVKAFETWSQVPSYERSKILGKIAALITERAEDFAHLESLDNGKTVKDSSAVDIPLVIRTFEFYSGMADKMEGKTFETEPNDFSFTRREPVGVCGAIIPWNFPLLMLAWKVGPALACGNCLILKSSEKTPLTALLFAQVCADAGLPPGVFSALSGFGPTVGTPLAQHMDVHKIAFTGSTAVGRKVMTMAAESNLKKVSLELGGKSPNIIFDDADLDLAVSSAAVGIYFNHGQVCSAGSRIFVQEGIYDEFVRRFAAHSKSITTGDQFCSSTAQGPQVDGIQMEKILGYVEKGKKEGLKMACGGSQAGDKGYFVQPTLFVDVPDSSVLAKEEIFGPVGCVMKFKTEEEVIRRANNTPYGLAAAVFTTNLSRAFRVEKKLAAGTVWINCYNAFDVRVPFGGYKESGFGREMSVYALDMYSQIKSVRVALAAE